MSFNPCVCKSIRSVRLIHKQGLYVVFCVCHKKRRQEKVPPNEKDNQEKERVVHGEENKEERAKCCSLLDK